MRAYHSLSVKQTVAHTQTSLSSGLSSADRAQRLLQHGPNALPDPPKPSLLKQVWEQLSNPIVMLLLGTAVVAGFTGEFFEAGLIIGIVLIMTAIGIYLEKQSEKSLDKLTALQTPFTTVLIDGKSQEVTSQSLVVGDVLLLQEGDLIPADARVVVANEAQTNEASLTGESLPVSKSEAPVAETATLAEQHSLIFSGTSLIQGNVKAIVIRTGVDTEIGKIATYLNEAETELTPLQQELESVGKFLLYATLGSVGLILAIYVVRGQPLIESLLATTSLAIAFIPEGLSAVLTITLALAVSEMVRKKVIVKRLVAAEGLGSITHIATDKTGTMTEGQMRVEQVYLDETLYAATDQLTYQKNGAYQRFMDVIRYCNNNKGPTEQALVTFLEKNGFSYELEGRHLEHRFTSDLKRMSVVREEKGEFHLFSKGAPDVLIPLSHFVLKHDQVVRFSASEQQQTLLVAEKLASQGFRVLALADKIGDLQLKTAPRERSEQKLCFIGLVALMDPLRPTVKKTVAGLIKAGVTPLMITGDHPAIARYIAEQAGLITFTKNNHVPILTGPQLDELLVQQSSAAQRDLLLTTRVFARVKPEHKVLLVDFYQQQGYRIAMTGDGINDAAAIKKANIGIAMSNGAGLTKDIADVVITGAYDALLRAVSIGRTVIVRTQLYLHYLLSGNACEVGIFFLAVFFHWPTPLTPIMLLLINLLTDALPAIAMAVEPEDPDLIKQPQTSHDTKMLSPVILRGIVVQGLLSTLLMAWVYSTFLPQGTAFAQTAVFTFYIFQKALRGFTARSLTKSVIEYGFFTNRLMNLALTIVVLAWLIVVGWIPTVFGMTHLSWSFVGELALLALLMPMAEEMTKFWPVRPQSQTKHIA